MTTQDDNHLNNPTAVTADQVNIYKPYENSPGIVRDVGAIAADIMRKRSKARRVGDFFTKLYILLTVSVFVIMGAVGQNLWERRETGYAVDTRPCEYKLNDRVTITGVRSYSYPYIDILGMRFINKDDVTEKTNVDVRGKGFSVVGITGEDWWGTSVAQGERGVQLLKKSDSYTFVFEEGIGVVPYSKLCR